MKVISRGQEPAPWRLGYMKFVNFYIGK